MEDIQALLRRLRIKRRSRVEKLLQQYVDADMLADEREKIDKLLNDLFKV
jgi:hypothetical protein